MIGAIILIIFLFVVTLPVLANIQNRLPWFNGGIMKSLYWYHILFALIYYIYVQYSASDSVAYYTRASMNYETWGEAYGTGTPFIDFLAYPFIKFFGCSYQMMMVLFAYMGYWGFVLFYIFFKENIDYHHYLFGISLITIIIFLPNMHY